MSVSAPTLPASLVAGRKFVPSRPIEKTPQHGEKPFVRLVEDAFDGPTLTWSQRMRLLEEANARKIRRGDALDVIASAQRRREKQHAIQQPSALQRFARQYACFAAGYAALAIAWYAIFATN